MTDIITEQDIFLLRGGFGTQDGNAEAMLVFGNGRGLYISQDDLNPSTIPLKDTKFRLTTMRVATLPFNKTAELCNSSDHPIESMKGEYERRGFTLAQAADIATQLSAAEPVGEFTTEEIVDYALEHGPYRPSQIGTMPISTNNGMELNAEILRTNMRQGKLRTPLDLESPMKFDLFWQDDEILLTPTNPSDYLSHPFEATNILLPTGHAVKITSSGTAEEPKFNVTTLVPDPDQGLKLIPAYVKGIGQSTLEASREHAIKTAIELGLDLNDEAIRQDITDQQYGEDNPTITNLSLYHVRQTLNDMIKRRSVVSENDVPLIIEANKRGDLVIGQHTNYSPDLYPITQFDGEEFDPFTGRKVDLFSTSTTAVQKPTLPERDHE